jgi:excisionase family DNA binding protein
MSARHPDLLTWSEAAAMLGCSVTTLKRIRVAGEIGFLTVGSGTRPRVYFTTQDIEEYLEAKRIAPRSSRRKEAS